MDCLVIAVREAYKQARRCWQLRGQGPCWYWAVNPPMTAYRNADPVGVGERVCESHQSRPDLTSPWTMATDVSKVSRGGCAARIALSEAGSNSVVRSGVAAILMTAARTMWQTPTGKGNACGRRNRVGYE